MIKRTIPLKRTPVKRRRKGTRRGPAGIPPEQWRNPAYLEFLRENGRCVVCHLPGCDPCHGPVNGTSSKGPDASAIPMCRREHDEQTRIGWPAFEKLHGIDREREALIWWTAFQLVGT